MTANTASNSRRKDHEDDEPREERQPQPGDARFQARQSCFQLIGRKLGGAYIRGNPGQGLALLVELMIDAGLRGGNLPQVVAQALPRSVPGRRADSWPSAPSPGAGLLCSRTWIADSGRPPAPAESHGERVQAVAPMLWATCGDCSGIRGRSPRPIFAGAGNQLTASRWSTAGSP